MRRRNGFWDTYPYIILALGALFLLIKTPLSFCWSDETFYFSTAYRFYLGDCVFYHDWFPTQLSGIMLLPFMAAFITVTGSTKGILLYFRVLYVIFEFISALVTYRILSRISRKSLSTLAAVCVLFYSHLNIATLSYYTFSFHFLLMSLLLIVHYYRVRKRRYLVISGVLLALSVLSLPTLAIAYFLVVICLLILMGIVKGLSSLTNYYSSGFRGYINFFTRVFAEAEIGKVLLYNFFGILIPAAGFFVFLLTNVSISDFISAIPYVLSDEEHSMSLVYPFKKFFIGINMVYGWAAYAGYALIIVTLIYGIFVSYRNYKRDHTIASASMDYTRTDDILDIIRTVLLVIDVILFGFYCYGSFGHTGYIQTALMMFALPLFFMTEHRMHRLFFVMTGGGLILAMVYSYSSDGGFLYTLSMGHFIVSIAGIVMIGHFVKDFSNVRTISYLTVISSSLIILCTLHTIAMRVVNVYRDAPITKLSAVIEEGPAYLLHTTPEHKQMYEDVYETITTYATKEAIKNYGRNDGDGYIYISKLLPFGYLCTDLKVGAPTTWRIPLSSERLYEYLSVHPERKPDVILVLNEEYGSYDTCGDVEADPNPNANDPGELFTKYIEDNNMISEEVSCGVLYHRQPGDTP